MSFIHLKIIPNHFFLSSIIIGYKRYLDFEQIFAYLHRENIADGPIAQLDRATDF